MGLRETWIDAIHRTATGTKRTRTLLTPIGVTVFCLFTVLFVVVATFVDTWLDLPNLLAERARLPVSIPVIAIGVTVAGWAALHFLKVKGTPVPFNPPPQLVKTGPYKYARNPMLTGVFVFLLGVGLFVNSVSLIFFFTPLFVLINLWELKAIEEPELMKRLGDDYIEYWKQTPMFIPGCKPRQHIDSQRFSSRESDQKNR